MKMLLLLLCAVTLILGVVGIAKAIPIDFTEVRYPTFAEPTTMLLLGFGLIGLAGFGRELSGRSSPSEGNQMRTIPQDNGGRRSRFDRREFSYTVYSPERRSGKDRRSRTDRRKIKRTLYAC